MENKPNYFSHYRDELVRNAWLWKCGLPESDYIPVRHYNPYMKLEDVSKTEWSLDFATYVGKILHKSNIEWNSEFEKLQRNRLNQGAYHYGLIDHTGLKENRHKYYRIQSIKKRFDKYLQTGNQEYIIDIANIAMLEYVECQHPKAFVENVVYDLSEYYISLKQKLPTAIGCGGINTFKFYLNIFIEEFQESGNKDFLGLINASCIIEWIIKSHSNAHFQTIEDSEVHQQRKY